MSQEVPWFDRPMRFAQVLLREADPPRVDVAWWKERWRECRLGGVAVSAGGLVAFYPTEVPFHRRSRWLGERDLFGELVEAAKDLGLVVLARIDPSRMHRELYYAHPDWAMMNEQGQPRREGDLFYTCVNTAYYLEYLPTLMREIAGRYPIDGFLGHNWQGLRSVCYCPRCARKFERALEMPLPRPSGASREEAERSLRSWQRWRREVDEQLWTFLDRVAKEVRPGAIWVGDATRGRVAALAEFVNTELTGERGSRPLWTAGVLSRSVRAMAGQSKPAYVTVGLGSGPAGHAFPTAEILSSLAQVCAHGAWPWLSAPAVSHDSRMWDGVANWLQWLQEHEAELAGQGSLASVAVVYSGRDTASDAVDSHVFGTCWALLQHRIPFDLVETEKVQAGALQGYRVAVLPSVLEMSDSQCQQIRSFVSSGGGLVATYRTSMVDPLGSRRTDFGLADVLGVTLTGTEPVGPLKGAAYHVAAAHPIVEGLEGAGLLPAASHFALVHPLTEQSAPLTLLPPSEEAPIEYAQVDVATAALPMALVHESERSRIVYFPGDIDREVWERNTTDLARVLANAVRWAHRDPLPITVEGPGLLDIGVHAQGSTVRVHLVSLSSVNAWRGNVDTLLPVGPQHVQITLAEGQAVRGARLLVAGKSVDWESQGTTVRITVPSVEVQEVLLVELGPR